MLKEHGKAAICISSLKKGARICLLLKFDYSLSPS